MQHQTQHSQETIALTTYLREDYSHTARHAELSIHDTNADLFSKCAAAWPQIFRTANDIERLTYVQDELLIEIVSGCEKDLKEMKHGTERGQKAGRERRVEIYLWGGTTGAEALSRGIASLGM